MAIGASIYKVVLNISNLNTHSYQDFNLTMAKHPSESEARLMNRLVAFCHCAHEDLEFTKGLSTKDEPEIWQKDMTGEIVHWIELGQPDEKRIKQAAGKSKRVSIFTTHPNTSLDWFKKIENKIPKEKVFVYFVKILENGPIDKFVERGMRLSCTIEEGLTYLGNDDERITIEVENLTGNF